MYTGITQQYDEPDEEFKMRVEVKLSELEDRLRRLETGTARAARELLEAAEEAERLREETAKKELPERETT